MSTRCWTWHGSISRSDLAAQSLERARSAAPGGPRVIDLDAPLDFDEFHGLEHQRITRALAVTFGDTELAREAVDEAMTRALQRWATVCRLERPGVGCTAWRSTGPGRRCGNAVAGERARCSSAMASISG